VTLSFQTSAEECFVEMQAEREENKKIKSHIAIAGFALAVCAYVGAVGTTAAAATLWTSNVGSDSAGCGASASPCRSISQAIENAAAGDTIYVGPGRYGDINGDGNFTGPGDEHPDPTGGDETSQPPVEGCIVCITKPLHIYSLQGAPTTVIASNPQSPYGSTVMILSPGVDFGSAGHGFTLLGGSQYGVMISLSFPVLQNLSIAGNIDNGDVNGFAFYGVGYNAHCSFEGQPGTDCRFPARILIANNQAIGTGTGFSMVLNNSFAGPIIIKDNVALGAGTGFSVIPGNCCTLRSSGYSAAQVQLVNNVAVGGGVGFSASKMGPIEYNTALNNSQAGFEVAPDGASFYNNSAIGNGGPGVIVTLYDEADVLVLPEPIQSAFVPFNGNNFIDNDRNRPVLSLGSSGFNPGPSAHCGVLIGIFLPLGFPGFPLGPTLMQLPANGNYWGSANGPSSSGPADAVGGACEQDNAKTIASSFSKTPFPVSSNP
jgi:hypothetical protein